MKRTTATRLALGASLVLIVGIWQWQSAIPVLVEIAIEPTPLVSFYAANQSTDRAIRLLLAPSSERGVVRLLDRRFGLVPGRLQRSPGPPDGAWQVISTVGRAWLPRLGFQVWRSRLAAASGVRGVFDDPRITFDTTVDRGCGATVEAREAEIKTTLQAGIINEAAAMGDGVLIALADTGLDAHRLSRERGVTIDEDLSWPDAASKPPLVDNHGTNMAFDATIAAPKATLADIHLWGELGIRLGELQTALPHFIAMLQQGRGARYTGIVWLNSWTMDNETQSGDPGGYSHDPLHPVTATFHNLTTMNVDVVFAAGNTGCANSPSTGTIFGAASHSSTLTVAAVDISKNLLRLSSNGPGRSTMSLSKPDLSSYSGFYRHDNSRGAGTSSAAAVAAGVVAALRSISGYGAAVMSPDVLKTTLIGGADRQVIENGTALVLTGHHLRFGYGVIRSPR